MKPLVSIIIPLYNGSNYLEAAIKSALAQTYRPIEIIVVNDGSTDNGSGKAICDRYADRITYLEKENGGCASALNLGIRHARGQFISWLSHDDLYTPEKVEKQVAMYARYKLDRNHTILSSCGALIGPEGQAIWHPVRRKTGYLSPWQAFSHILLKSCPNGCGLLIPRTCFEKHGGFEQTLHFVHDWQLWLKFAISGVDYYFDQEKLVYHRLHPLQVSVLQKERYAAEMHAAVDLLFAYAAKMPACADYLASLYAFSYACNYGDTRAMGRYLQAKMQRINRPYCVVLKIRHRLRLLAKKLYRSIR